MIARIVRELADPATDELALLRRPRRHLGRPAWSRDLLGQRGRPLYVVGPRDGTSLAVRPAVRDKELMR